MTKKQLEISELIHEAILAKENNSDKKFCSQNTIWSTIEIFNYNPEEVQTFEPFDQKYQDFFDIDCQTLTDEKKIRLRLSKLGTNEHKFTDFILLKKTRDLKFNEAIELLKELFNPRLSISQKMEMLKYPKKNESEDLTTFALVINKTFDDFRLSELTADNFKCLIFVLGLVSRKDSDMRRRILTKLENEQNMSLQQLTDYCQQHDNIKQDSQKIEEAGIANVRRIWKSPASTNKNHYRKNSPLPR